jgi:hypothetical protein
LRQDRRRRAAMRAAKEAGIAVRFRGDGLRGG